MLEPEMDSTSSAVEEAALRVRGGSGGGLPGVFNGWMTGSESPNVEMVEDEVASAARGGRAGLYLGPNISLEGLV